MSIYTVNGSPVKYDNKWLAPGGTHDLPPYNSTDAGKALVVNNEGDDVEWKIVGSSGTVDQHYDSHSSNPQSGTAVAEALQTVPDELPSITGNSNKVLKVNADATGVEWATESAGATYTAGSNIQINGNVISATDTTYTAGTGLTLNGTEFSADTTVLATQQDLSGKQNALTAGSNITITGDTISATDTTYSAGTGLSLNGTTFSNADPLPAHTSGDNGKILKVDAHGDLEWGTQSGGTSYTQGNMISLANDQIAVSTTAGITDIQFVNALPANPVATVLYLIPVV